MKFRSAFPLILLAAAVAAGDGTVVAEAGAAPAAPAEAPAPTPAKREARQKVNGVARPSPGTATGQVWEIADKISNEKGRPALRAEVTAAGAEAGINPSTVTTQFGQWRRYYGLKKEEKVAPAEGAEKSKKSKKAKAETTASTPEQLEQSNAASAAAIEETNAAEAAGAPA